MKILVCISKTPDTTAKIAFTDNNTKFAEAGVQWILNPYDEWYSLVRAIELKEADAATVVHLVTVGNADAEPIIRKALALGGDEAIRVNAQPLEGYQVATQIAEVAKQGGYDIIFTGKETIDYNDGIVGGMIAEMLDLPYIAQITEFKLNGTTSAVPLPSVMVKAFTFSEMTLISVLIVTLAKALPEKTFLRTLNPPDVSGNAVAPATRPAFSRTATLGAKAFPLELFEKTMIFAPVCCATCAIIFACTCESKALRLSFCTWCTFFSTMLS